MKFFDYVALGFKNIWRRKSRSFLTIFAVVIGAISIIIMLSLVLGAKQVATHQLESIDGLTLMTVSANPEIQNSGNLINTDTYGDDTTNKLNDSTVETIKQILNVLDATPIAGVWVKSISLEGSDKKYRANIVAYTPGTKVLNIPVAAGRSLVPEDMDKIVIGSELLRNLGYSNNPGDIIGKKLVLYTQEYVDWGADPPKPPEGDNKEYFDNIQNQPHNVTVEIVGVVTGGVDESQNYITMGFGKRIMTSKNWKYDDQKMKQLKENQSQLEEQLRREQAEQKSVYIKSLMTIPDNNVRNELFDEWNKEWDKNISEQLAAAGFNQSATLILDKQDNLARNGYSSILLRVDKTENIESVAKSVKQLGFGVQTAKDMLDQIKKIFNLIGLIIGAIGGIVLFVAALGIINNMIMATYERTREIGILRACGATRGTIRNMFIFEAGLLGFLGGAIGLVISFGLAKIMNIVGNQIAISQGVPIQNIISFQPWLVISVIALTTLIGALAGLLPAIRASRMDPVEALRYE